MFAFSRLRIIFQEPTDWATSTYQTVYWIFLLSRNMVLGCPSFANLKSWQNWSSKHRICERTTNASVKLSLYTYRYRLVTAKLMRVPGVWCHKVLWRPPRSCPDTCLCTFGKRGKWIFDAQCRRRCREPLDASGVNIVRCALGPLGRGFPGLESVEPGRPIVVSMLKPVTEIIAWRMYLALACSSACFYFTWPRLLVKRDYC